MIKTTCTDPLIPIFAVHVVGGATNGERRSANDQRPFDAEFVDQRASKETYGGKHCVAYSSAAFDPMLAFIK